MAKLTPRSIDWIDHAPIRVEARAESTATAAQVFAVLADHERWPEWFPSVKQVTVIGAAEGVGARRRVAVPGATFDEEFIVWEPGARWSFTGIEAKPGVLRSLVEDCRLEPLASGGTAISYTMYLDPPPLLRPLVRVMTRGMRRNNRRAMANLAQRAAASSSKE
ncbi:MAG: SRPBCC family protein [Acidimicrobiales bacterium]